MTRLLNTLDSDACTEEQGAIMHEYMIAFSESEDNSDMENVLAFDVLLAFSFELGFSFAHTHPFSSKPLFWLE